MLNPTRAKRKRCASPSIPCSHTWQALHLETACFRVVNTVELLELILYFLPRRNILLFSRTSKLFCETIRDSSLLQKRLFFKNDDRHFVLCVNRPSRLVSLAPSLKAPPFERDPGGENKTKLDYRKAILGVRIYNPALFKRRARLPTYSGLSDAETENMRRRQEKWRHCKSCYMTMLGEHHQTMRLTFEWIHVRCVPDASCRSMYLTQPSTQHVRVGCSEFGGLGPKITNPDGITLYDVYQAASRRCMTRNCVEISIDREETLLDEEELAWVVESKHGLHCPASLSKEEQ